MAGVVQWNNGFVMQSARDVTGSWDARGQWAALRQSRYPFWVNEMVGLGEFIIEMGPGASWGTDNEMHNFNPDWLVNEMSRLCGGDWNGSRFVINVRSGSRFVGARKVGGFGSTGDCFWFGGSMNQCESIVLNVRPDAHILGRGAPAPDRSWVGGGWSGLAPRGGSGIVVVDGVGPKMAINLEGVIGGGGGSSGPSSNGEGPEGSCGVGGHGGSPFGEGGQTFYGQVGQSAPYQGGVAQANQDPRIWIGQSGSWGEYGLIGGEGSHQRGNRGQGPGRGIRIQDGQPWPNIPGYPNAGWIPGGIGQ
ncbi:tail fiber protein [Serratia phage 92A1]|nr:tail fiber protein [Serratia phage 92A1]